MIKRVAFLLIVITSFPSRADPSREDIAWKYPCDLYFFNTCSHLPVGTSAHYSVPSDFGVSILWQGEDGREILRIYSGDHPNASRRPKIASFSEGAQSVDVHATTGGDELYVDVYVRPSNGGTATHILGTITADNSVQFREFIGALRACVPRKDGFSCPTSPRLGGKILSALDVFSRKKTRLG